MEEENDIENPYVQSLLFTELFQSLENCDSMKVDNFWEELENSILEIKNPNV